jgi:hypothetical protein
MHCNNFVNVLTEKKEKNYKKTLMRKISIFILADRRGESFVRILQMKSLHVLNGNFATLSAISTEK